ncbi:LysR family transcriptional regulator [Yersinia pestis]|nr:LysR family transcriptional regulator [Yersinia pestis]EDR34460.1 substrate-binding transcriptional regulator, LysR family [Yersinia pestis biovar Orientalis str. IP275]EFA47733.1 LysR substrate binding domain protein [Yersinia pestis KIM D27]ABG15419.1 transcriptional regulator [Yersinia pestis Antiqua]ABG20091.1 transcriptional regulator [Yersinia pestis Nepal516]ABP42164.1 transcriptional regulator [Yersinia pestis Pestoides F]
MQKKNDRNSIKIMQIRAFCMTAEQGAASLAALNLFRTQSAITRSIRDLEHTLAISLFERHAKGMLLTDLGNVILPRARSAMEELTRIPALLRRLQQRDDEGIEDLEPTWLFNERRLQIFLSLYRQQHALHVAQALDITQSAVSAALKVLEKGAGMYLFHRTPKGMLPTPAGHEIAPCISRALNALHHIPEEITAHRGDLTGSVRVGALPLSRARLLPQAMIKLISRHPGIKIVTNESGFTALIAELRAGDIDFIIGALRNEKMLLDIHSEILFEEELILLARPNHPLSDRRVKNQELKDIQWVLPRNHAPSRHLLEVAFCKMGLASPQPVVESGDPAVVRALLLGSDMVAAVSSHQLDFEVSEGILIPLQVNLTGTRREIGLMTRQKALNSPATDALINCVREVIQSSNDK